MSEGKNKRRNKTAALLWEIDKRYWRQPSTEEKIRELKAESHMYE
jgi:hypothetical protein